MANYAQKAKVPVMLMPVKICLNTQHWFHDFHKA